MGPGEIMKLLAVRRRPAATEASEIGRFAGQEVRVVCAAAARVREMYSPGRPGVVFVLDAARGDAEAARAGLPLVAAASSSNVSLTS